MEYDKDKVDRVVLALLQLTAFDNGDGTSAWKSHAWDVLDRLHEQGLISDPKNKNKSIVLSPAGARKSAKLFARYFGKQQ